MDGTQNGYLLLLSPCQLKRKNDYQYHLHKKLSGPKSSVKTCKSILKSFYLFNLKLTFLSSNIKNSTNFRKNKGSGTKIKESTKK